MTNSIDLFKSLIELVCVSLSLFNYREWWHLILWGLLYPSQGDWRGRCHDCTVSCRSVTIVPARYGVCLSHSQTSGMVVWEWDREGQFCCFLVCLQRRSDQTVDLYWNQRTEVKASLNHTFTHVWIYTQANFCLCVFILLPMQALGHFIQWETGDFASLYQLWSGALGVRLNGELCCLCSSFMVSRDVRFRRKESKVRGQSDTPVPLLP